MGDRARGQRRLCRQHGRRAGSLPEAARSQAPPRIPSAPSYASMKRRSNASPRRARRSPRPGQAERYDYEYERNGVANLFMMFAPLKGWRRVKVTDRRAAVDYAHALKDLSDMHFPGADKIVLVQDNLSTHTAASLYEAFPPPKRAASSNDSNGVTRPSTEAGSTWPNPNSPSSRPNASIAASPTRQNWSPKSPPGKTPKHTSRQGRLAIHNRRRPRQARKPIPSVRLTQATRACPQLGDSQIR